ncbi:MFS transporter [Streptacidiphilus jiangxiensis]|uniref:Major Facilitator Superfamily protein n=1 Tax=Streptacidiphilus jiangxiensis TaxID=235985 RepID=A0A1H7QZ35_STRJI|nr:MFS transporter [Streptacidiphilus jiangxiensis]SEL52998.1 Major Facilitator Superfamily protein [Streptacidiphilus jiangxiensis]
MRTLLTHRDALLFLGAQSLSQFGDNAMLLVLGVWAKTLTHSNASAGLVYFALTVPTLAAPLGGMLVDRVRRRPLLVAGNLATGTAVLCLLAVHDAGGMALLYAVALVYGASRSVLGAAQSALLTTLLPAELLAPANAALQTTSRSLRLLAPLAGAGLFAAFGAGPVIWIDVTTFAVAAAATAALTHREARPTPTPAGTRWSERVLAGSHHLLARGPLRDVTLAAAAAMLVLGFGETIVFAVVGTGLHRPPAFLGVLLTLQGIGAVLGGLTAAAVIRRLGDVHAAALGMAACALGNACYLTPWLGTVTAGFAVNGLATSWVAVAFVTTFQSRTPKDLQGRVYAAADLLTSGPQALSIAVGAALVGVLDYRVLLLAMTTVPAAAALRLRLRSAARPAAPVADGAAG